MSKICNTLYAKRSKFVLVNRNFLRFGCRLVLALLTFSLSAQVAIKQQPAAGYFELIEADAMKKSPPEADLLKMKPVAPPTDLDAILKGSDWIASGNYHYSEKKISLYYRTPTPQYHINRFLPDGGMLDFSINSPSNGGSILNHTNFSNPPNTKWNVVKKKGKFYIEDNSYGQLTYISIIGYTDGVLVIDISMNGRIGEKANFRSVMVAIPKSFEWNFGE
jgi:hypothetical protein